MTEKQMPHGIKSGCFGLDDVSWEVHASRLAADDAAYRLHKDEIDTQDRLAAKTALLFAHESDGGLYQDSDNILSLGYEKSGRIYVFGTVDMGNQTVTFGPLAIATRYMVKWAPFSQVFEQIRKFKKVAPKGCI